MKVIGLVGGIACGKSFIADALERLGAGRFDGDRAGHQTLCEPQVKQAVQELWGDEILDQKGEVIRRKLAEIVFAPAPNGPRELKRLEELVHPRIASALDLLLTELRTAGECPAVVVDAALLMEAGWDAQCDEVWFIDVPRETRLRRAKTRGWTEEEFSAR
ncbi:MAG: dephospho-CoA kinase, partial [Planctomycetales bacterium]